ncbi:HNH endonuclease [Candidatus Parcubacteria bacterium]|nr:HNH endonuclease [Candidatus Parcubacteria bacterium]
MTNTVHVFAKNYLRNLHSEIYKLDTNQSVDNFIKFFSKDEIFTIGIICKSNDEIQKYINEAKELLRFGKKIIFGNLDKLAQEWNEIIYLIKQKKSLENYFYQIIKASIFARKFKNEKIGTKNYNIDESFHFYRLRNTEEIILITNNSLLLKTEVQRRRYINKYIDYINNLTSTKNKRKTIPKKIKDDLWILYFGEERAQGDCYVCKTKIHISKFEAGHVTSDSEGGQPTIENLRPVCSHCNKSIKEENLYSYKRRHYPNN